MEKLKNNGEELSKDIENIIQNYLKLFGLKQSESLAAFKKLNYAMARLVSSFL